MKTSGFMHMPVVQRLTELRLQLVRFNQCFHTAYFHMTIPLHEFTRNL